MNKAQKNRKKQLEKLASQDLSWIPPLAHKVGEHADVIAEYLSEVLAQVITQKSLEPEFIRSRWTLARTVTTVLFPKASGPISEIERTFSAAEAAITGAGAELLRDPNFTRNMLPPLIRMAAQAIEENPGFVIFFTHTELMNEIFGDASSTLKLFIDIIPALSQKANETLPEFREAFFNSLSNLDEAKREELAKLVEDVLQEVYKLQIVPQLKILFANDPRGKVLTPILEGAILAIPGDVSLNTLLSIACTPRSQLNAGRMIAIAIQQMGGMYIKLSQVIAELCPPSLSRELRTNQDDAGGLFPSSEKSWEYFLSLFNRADLEHLQDLFAPPNEPQKHFASASVGALYEMKLSQKGRGEWGVQTVLIKVQRPGLQNLFKVQAGHLVKLCDETDKALWEDESFSDEIKKELSGISTAIRRSIINYCNQSSSELDFREEKKNADRVRAGLPPDENLVKIPKFFFSSVDLLITERMPGTKVTKIVQSKYLERRQIADRIAKTYLELLFEKGIVWADPHPGNILFDDITNRVSMIDLNPCFVWDESTRANFIHLIYRLLLRDAKGVYVRLYSLVHDQEALHSSKLLEELERFLKTPTVNGGLVRFVGEFLRTLAENNVELRVEVQAALRGLSQVALTSTAISARNSFGALLRHHFGVKELFLTAWQVGFRRVTDVITGLLFELIRHTPRGDVGPVLDERDLGVLNKRTRELTIAGVCNIRMVRRSPEDHSNLALSADGVSLLNSSDLKIKILEKRRPVTVKYIIEIPSRGWLRERQEFVKLSSIAQKFCIIECMEQLRRNSLDDYWHIVEAWNKEPMARTVDETKLVGQVKIAARKLYALRFARIWETEFVALPYSSRVIWKLLIFVESMREEAEQKYLRSLKAKLGKVILANLGFSTFYRMKMLTIEGFLYLIRNQVTSNKYSMNLLPMSTQKLEELVLFGLSRTK